MFEYDHSLLSLPDLHRKGVRRTQELEEVIKGYSFADEEELEYLGYFVIRFVGFTNASKPLKIACRLDERTGILVTLYVQIPLVEEIVNDFCKYC